MTKPSLDLRYRAPRFRHGLVAVDLGKRKCGVALGHVVPEADTYDALAAFTVSLPLRVSWDPKVMGWHVRQSVHHVIKYLGMPGLKQPTNRKQWRWVCEWPIKYPNAPKYHEDLDTLHAVGKEVCPKGWTKKYAPSAWKGQVPKGAHHTRILQATTERELSVIFQTLLELGYDTDWFLSEDAHDARDALGILHYAAGRTGRGGKT